MFPIENIVLLETTLIFFDHGNQNSSYSSDQTQWKSSITFEKETFSIESIWYSNFSLISESIVSVFLLVSIPPTHHAEQRSLPNASDLRQMCIITKSDLNRIYDNLERRQRDKDAIQQELQRKKEMAERSAEVTKLWSNTILVRLTPWTNRNWFVLWSARVHENVKFKWKKSVKNRKKNVEKC